MKELEHIAIILDGNGRWAKKRGLPRKAGHIEGAKTLEKICRAAYKRGIKYLTVYAFSTENWNRPEDEVSAIMRLFGTYLDKCIKNSKKDNMVVRMIGDRERLSDTLKDKVKELEEVSKDNTGLNLTIAINYGGRAEILNSFKEINKKISDGALTVDEITEDVISEYLYTKEIPDPDLILRTSGEMRLSNFLLWQAAYSEFLFVDCAWPDFDENELDKAIEEYNKRDRRFGAIKEDK